MFKLIASMFLLVVACQGAVLQDVTLFPEDNLIHGLVYATGKLWATTMTSPARLLRFDSLSDLNQYTTLVFPSDGNHDSSSDVIYSVSNNKVYACFGSSTSLLVSEVDPVSLKVTDRVDDSDSFRCLSLATDNTNLFLAGQDYYSGELTVSKFRMSDWSRSARVTVTNTFQSQVLRWDGTNLYCATHQQGCFVVRLNPSDLSYTTNSLPAVDCPITDDLGFEGSHVWLGSEGYGGHLVRVNKQDLSYTLVDTGFPGYASFGVYFDGTYIWNTVAASPGTLQNITPGTLAFRNITLNSGDNLPNEIASDGKNLFVTCFISPTHILRVDKGIPKRKGPKKFINNLLGL